METVDVTKFDWNIIRNNIYSEWKDIESVEFAIERLSGLSNYVYKMYVPRLVQVAKPIVYKIFTDYFISMQDRQREMRIAQMLYQQQLGPKIYFGNSKIRIEEYWPYDHVPVEEMTKPEKMNQIAHLLALFHQNKIIKVEDASAKFIDHLQRPSVLSAVKNAVETSDLQQEQKNELIDMVDVLFSKKMIDYAENSMKEVDTPIVFAHNDTNSTNLLFDQLQQRIYFLDYEYAGYNYRSFEFGNFFNEQLWDYEVKEPPFFAIKKELYPSDSVRYAFFANYILASIFNNKNNSNQETGNGGFSYQPSQYCDLTLPQIYTIILNQGDNRFQKEQDILKEIQKLDNEANAGKLLSHMCWFLVAALTLSYKDLHFDCYTYCKLRFSEIKLIVGQI